VGGHGGGQTLFTRINSQDAHRSVGFSDLKVLALGETKACVRNLLRLARDVAHEARTSPRAWLIKITTFDS